MITKPKFFELDVIDIKKLGPSLVPKCGTCGYFKHCNTPKMPVEGDGLKKILLVDSYPSEMDDIVGKHFSGKTGSDLEMMLKEYNINMRRDCWITSSVICKPTAQKPILADAKIVDKEIKKALDYCKPNLLNTIKELKPEIVITFGDYALRSMMSWLWKENDVGSLARWTGWTIPSQKHNFWICPLEHPAWVSFSDYGESGKKNQVREVIYKKYLDNIFKLKGRPWKDIPNYSDSVEVVMDEDRVVHDIKNYFLLCKKPVAWDYETTTLKAEGSEARIYSCSLSDGKITIAYPWTSKTKHWTQKFLKSDVRKIASNMKFEERWTWKEFGHGVTNWWHDTMIAAHILDNRPDITSIKFLAWVMLGQDIWDTQVHKFLEGKDSNSKNRIEECSLPKLLKYNGMDSLIEYKIAMKQHKIFKGEYDE